MSHDQCESLAGWSGVGWGRVEWGWDAALSLSRPMPMATPHLQLNTLPLRVAVGGRGMDRESGGG